MSYKIKKNVASKSSFTKDLRDIWCIKYVMKTAQLKLNNKHSINSLNFAASQSCSDYISYK